MVEYPTPNALKERLLEEKRRKKERQKKLREKKEREALEETRRSLSDQPSTPYYPPYTPQRHDEIPRRTAVNRMALYLLLLGTGAVAGIGALFHGLPSTSSQPPVQQPVEEQTQGQQTQQPEIKTTNPMSDPNNWPVRNSLDELRNALREPGSFSQYSLQEYYSLPGDNLYNSQRDFANITQDEFLAIHPDAIESDIKMVMGGNPRITLFSVDDHPYSYIFFDMTLYTGKKTFGYGNYYVPYDRIVKAFANGNQNYNVLFKNNSGLNLTLKAP